MKTLLRKFTGLFTRRARVARLEEEVRAHIALLQEENLQRGLDPVEARRQAHLAFGNVLATREESVDAMGWPVVESWLQDVKIAVRTLLRRPAFAASLIAILALGIGVTTSIFTILRGVLWQTLPVPRAQEIYLVREAAGQPFLLSAPAVRRLEEAPALAGRVAAYSDTTRLMWRRGDEPAEPVDGQFVSGGFFAALEVTPWLGRLLTPEDDAPGQPRAVAVISWQWWQRVLGGAPDVLGRELRLNGQLVTVVGVAPRAFAGVSLGRNGDVWMPLGLHASLRASPSAWVISVTQRPTLADWVRADEVTWLNALVRKTDRVTEGELQGAVEAAWRPQRDSVIAAFNQPQERDEFMRRVPQAVASPQGFSDTRDSFRKTGLTLSLLVAAVVLVTLANTSTLLLLRMLARGREIGVRLALGAGRWRLVRAALMEGLVLSLVGSAAGLLIGVWLTPVLAAWLVPSTQHTLPGLDAALVGSLIGLATVSGLALGLLPAWMSAHLSPQVILRRGGVGQGGSLVLGRALIVMQLGLSVLLVSVAVALTLDLRKALRSNLGYARESVVTSFFNFSAGGIAPEQQPAVMARLRAAAETLPQVKAVGFAASGVLSGSRSSSGLYFRGDNVQRVPGGSVQHESIDEHYLSAMGTTLLRGRDFTADDADGKPRVALVSEQLARQVFGAADPVGRRFGFGDQPADDDMEIVGVVSDVRMTGARGEPAVMIYTPLAQWRAPAGCLAIRVEGEGAPVRELLKKTVSAAEPGLMFTRWLTIEERVQLWVRNDLAAVRLTTGFGVLAVLLAGIGVLGALGYLVANRSREIAVRLAIGAEPGRVWRGIVREALVLGVLGAGLGLGLAAWLPRVLESWMMTGLKTDWVALIGAAVVGVAAAVLGGLLPARRAAKVDPLTLLKSE